MLWRARVGRNQTLKEYQCLQTKPHLFIYMLWSSCCSCQSLRIPFDWNKPNLYVCMEVCVQLKGELGECVLLFVLFVLSCCEDLWNPLKTKFEQNCKRAFSMKYIELLKGLHFIKFGFPATTFSKPLNPVCAVFLASPETWIDPYFVPSLFSLVRSRVEFTEVHKMQRDASASQRLWIRIEKKKRNFVFSEVEICL